MPRKFFPALVLVFLLLTLTLQLASAHATLIKADPAPNSLAPTAPQQVTLWFDEPVDVGFSSIQVLDQSQTRYDAAHASSALGDPKQIFVPLKSLPDGTYVVAWQALSAADGHITRGNFAFSVGTVTASIPTTSESAAGETAPFSIFARWLELISILALVGAIFFRETVLAYSLRAVDADPALADARWMQLARVALVLALTAEIARLVLQAGIATNAITLPSISEFLFDTRLGWLWLWRFALIGFLGLLLNRVTPRISLLLSASGFLLLASLYFGGLGNNPSLDALGRLVSIFIASWNAGGALHHLAVLGSPFLVFFVIGAYQDEKTRRFVLWFLSLAALFTLSLGGHGAAQGDFSFGTIADWLHLTAVSFWVGGLAAMAWVVAAVWRALPPDKSRTWLGVLIPRFSFVALVSVGVILITGLYASVEQIPSFAALAQTLYGESLIVKVALFLVMLSLGSFHLLVTTKRINVPNILRDFRALVAIEAAVGAVAIALAAFMTLSAPARATVLAAQYAQSQTQPKVDGVVLFAQPSSDVSLSLTARVTSAPQIFDALILDPNKKPAPKILRVIYEFTLLDQDIGVTRVNVDNGSQGHFVTVGNYLTLPGMWRVRVIVRRAGVEDIASEFPLYREGAVPATIDPNALALLKQSDAAMNTVKSVRATQELNDGENAVVVTREDLAAPDRVHATVDGGSETIAIGTTQYYRESAGWSALTRPDPYKFPAFNSAGLVNGAQLGRAEILDGKPTQIVLVVLKSSAGDTRYAYWINADDKLSPQYFMVAPAHFMVEYYRDFNAAVQVDAPKNIAPVAAPSVPPGANGPTTPSTRIPGPITGDLQSDLALGILVVALGIGLRVTDRERARNARLMSLGLALALAIAALLLLSDAVNATYQQFANTPINAQQAASGKVLYEQNCLVCHGETGYGNGPAAAALKTKPYDLTVHAFQHDESYFIAVIGGGRGEMPSFKAKLTTADMLGLINYMRQLARDAQAEK